MTKRILVIEDEPQMLLGLRDNLELEGYEVITASDGEDGLAKAISTAPDLVVLDITLPRKNGFEVCRELRARANPTPVVMLTARSQETEKVLGLELGADDYVTKPFSLRELRARVRAHLRRSARADERVCRFGECEVDFDRAELRRSGRPVDVTPQELRLLAVFLKNRGRVLSRDQLISSAWGPGMAITDRAVDTHVFNLRKKIEPVPSHPQFLVGVRGLGYRFNDDKELTES